MAPGGEFRVAFREAQKIPGCVVLLGDRAIDVGFFLKSIPITVKYFGMSLTAFDLFPDNPISCLVLTILCPEIETWMVCFVRK